MTDANTSPPPSAEMQALVMFFSALLEDKDPLALKAFAWNLDGIVRQACVDEKERPFPGRKDAIRVAQSFTAELRATIAA